MENQITRLIRTRRKGQRAAPFITRVITAVGKVEVRQLGMTWLVTKGNKSVECRNRSTAFALARKWRRSGARIDRIIGRKPRMHPLHWVDANQ